MAAKRRGESAKRRAESAKSGAESAKSGSEGSRRTGEAPRRSAYGSPSRNSWFTRFAKWTSRATGRPMAFAIAAGVILAWAVTGPMFHFSDTWQLVINTGTTIVTFLMVFLIQNTQYRDSEAIHVKLDELIRALEGAHNALLDLEDLDDKDLDQIRDSYAQLAEDARKILRGRGMDTGTPNVKPGRA